jgi:hypothetical protein
VPGEKNGEDGQRNGVHSAEQHVGVALIAIGNVVKCKQNVLYMR